MSWVSESGFEQKAFGKGGKLSKARGRPLPKFIKIAEERRRQAKIRKAGDALKAIAFRQNPHARVWSLYGSAVINGKNQKFSFDVLYDERKYPKGVKDLRLYRIKKEIYERLYRGEIPQNFYYQFFISPTHLQRTRWIEHQGITSIGQISRGKGKKGRFETWRPQGKKLQQQDKLAREISQKVRARNRYSRIKRSMQ